MKKFLICIILLMIPLMCFSGTSYVVDTSQGEKSVVVPDGMTCEDVMLTLAKNYYEISYEYDSVLEELGNLKSEVLSYIEENKSLRESRAQLEKDYQDLTKKQDKLLSKQNFLVYIKPSAIFSGYETSGLGASLGFILGTSSMIEVGCAFEYGSSTEASMKWSMGFGFLF